MNAYSITGTKRKGSPAFASEETTWPWPMTEEWKPRLTLKGFVLVSFSWLCYAVVTAGLITFDSAVPFLWLLGGQIITSVILGLYSLPVWMLMVRRLHTAHWGTKLSLHIILGPIYAVATCYSTEGFYRLANLSDAVESFEENRFWILFGNLTLYALQFALYHIIPEVRRSQQRKQQATELSALAREQELQALRSQLNPHFLFNVLHSINAMIGIDTEKARQMIAHLSELLRYILESGNHQLLPLEHELAVVKAYLSLEQIRFGDRLIITYDIDSSLLSTPVPPMTLQPLVENSVKHGLALSEQPESILITACRTERGIELGVENTCHGVTPPRSASERTGIGVQNINKRLTTLFGENAGIRVRNKEGNIRVMFTLPLHHYRSA